MIIEAKVLEDEFLALEPLQEAHRSAVREACAADPDVWSRLYSVSMIGPAFEPRFDGLLAERTAGRCLPFAVRARGVVVGLSCFLDIDRPNAVLEIGFTYYAPSARGGAVNPAAKRLLLAEAFLSGARRVVFKVDALNLRSRRAVMKLGAVPEGVLRQDRRVWTGRIRDTAVYSILETEWPDVRSGLEARLADFRARP